MDSISSVIPSAAGGDGRVLRPPSLRNRSEQDWESCAEVSYRFARLARHDMLNLQTGSQLLDVVERMQASGQAGQVPEHLKPDRIKKQIRQTNARIINIAGDVVLLSQCANRIAYRPARTELLAGVLRDAICSRLPKDAQPPSSIEKDLGNASVVVMGDSLRTALTVFFFQWTPEFGEADRITEMDVIIRGNHAELLFSVPDSNAEEFASVLGEGAGSPRLGEVSDDLADSIIARAAYLACHVTMVHGGAVDFQGGEAPRLSVSLPLAPAA